MGVRTDRYKLIFFYGLTLGMSPPVSWDTNTESQPGWELYDLREDPKELKNQYENPAYASEISRLKKELARLRVKFGDRDRNRPRMQMLLRAQFPEDLQ